MKSGIVLCLLTYLIDLFQILSIALKCLSECKRCPEKLQAKKSLCKHFLHFTFFTSKFLSLVQKDAITVIPLKKFNIQAYFFQFLWWIISRIHLSLPNAYKLMG